jgi:rhomboid protease GluP
MCPNCRAFITTADKICPYCDAEVGERAIDRRSPADVAGGLIPHARFTTVLILLINTGLYAACVLHGAQSGAQGPSFDLDGRTLVMFGAKFGPFIAAGQWWRLITAGFLHGGIMHILMNSWVLFDLGAQVEETYGTARYLVIYFVSTITGFYASYYFLPQAPSVGASAAICGLLGAMIALGTRDRTTYGSAMRGMYIRWALFTLAFGIMGPLFGMAIDNAAHIGGIAGGFLVAYAAGTPTLSSGLERGWKILAGMCVVLTGLAFAQLFQWFFSIK